MWQGYNARVSDTALNPKESGDESNAFHFGAKRGLLGPRKGVAQSARPAYNIRLGRPFIFRGPWGTYTIAPTLGGTVNVYTGSDRSGNVSGYATLGLTSGYLASGTDTFTGSASFNAANYPLVNMVTSDGVTNGNFLHSSGTTSSFAFGTVVNGAAEYGATLTTTGSGNSRISTGDGITVLGVAFAGPTSGTVTGSAFTPSGGGSGTVWGIG